MKQSSAHTDLHHVLSVARQHSYTTHGQAWRQIIASLVFETNADLSLVADLDEQDQARLFNILASFMNRTLRVEEISSVYLEFFPHPEDRRVEGWEN